MGTGARTPKPDAYPSQLREELALLRGTGVESFDVAWSFALERVGVPPGWNHAYPEQPDETPLVFARRHFEAAWADETPLRYCQAEGCFNLTERRYCGCTREAVAA